MPFLRTTLCGWVLSLALAAAAGASQSLALMPVSGSNVHQGYLEAAGDVLRGHLAATGKYEVIAVPGPVSRTEISKADAIAQARAAGAELAMVLHIARLGSSAQVRASVYEVSSGDVAYADQLRAASPDDLDPVLSRLVTGMLTGSRARQSGDIYSVTGSEADPLLKRDATGVWGIKLGFSQVRNRPQGSSGSATAPGAALFWLYDVRNFLAEVELGFHNGQDATDSYLGLGVFRPLGDEATSPYVGGGMRYVGADNDDDSSTDSGIQIYAGAGVLFGRMSSVQVLGDLSFYVNTFGEGPGHIPFGVDGERRKAFGVIVNLGIGF
ncbi:MAG: hypothetical protein ABIL09_22750 [Gemmatimonadota bacterium]